MKITPLFKFTKFKNQLKIKQRVIYSYLVYLH